MEELKDKEKEISSFWQRPGIIVPVVIVLLGFLLAAVWVVVKNVGRVQIGPVPVTLSPIPRDTTMSRVRRQLARGIDRLERRLFEYRGKLDSITFAQDSLFRVCSSGLRDLRERFAFAESAHSYPERKERVSQVRKEYARLRDMVNDFVRSVDSTISQPALDSLDREFRKLLSE